jgi:hypothetical protein
MSQGDPVRAERGRAQRRRSPTDFAAEDYEAIGSGAQQSKTSVKSVGVSLRSDSPNATESAASAKTLLFNLDGTWVDTTLAVESTWRWAADNLTCHSHN